MQKQQIQLNSAEEIILKEISSGKFKDEYLIYNRKSTDEPQNQKNSIKYQKSENVRFAYREHLPIASITLPGFSADGIISERHSGFKEDTALIFGEEGTVQYRINRPKFYRLVQFLNLGYFKGVVVLCWDRASRNRGDDTVIRKLMKQGLDFRFPLASYDKTSSGALHMDIDGMFAEHHSRVTSEKVSMNIRMKQDQGYCTQKAPVGYLNLGNMEDKPIDPVRGPIIKKMFTLYATGEWSLADIARWAIEQGFTMPPSRRPRTKEEMLQEEDEDDEDIKKKMLPICRIPTFNSIHIILNNRFYLGEIRNSQGDYVPSKCHVALTTKEIFKQVQELLNKKKVSIQYIKKLRYPLRGLVRCAICERVYTPYMHKGTTYYGSRCAKECLNKRRSVNLEYLLNEIDVVLRKLYFTEQELERMAAAESTEIAIFEIKRHNQLEINNAKKKKVREDLTYLNSNRLALLKSGAYTPETIVVEEKNLNEQLRILQEEEQLSDVSMQETISELKKLSELLKIVCLYYENGNPYEKERVVKEIFSELLLDENGLKYKVKMEYKPFETRFFVPCALTTWLSEAIQNNISVKRGIKILEVFIVPKELSI